MLEQQGVLATTGQNMQGEADLPEKITALDQLIVFARAQKAVADQFVQGAGAKMPLGDPTDHLQVAQAAGTVLDVRLQVKGCFVVFVAACAAFFLFAFEKRAVRPDSVGAGHGPHPLEQVRRADQQAGFHQAGGDCNVGGALAGTILNRAYAMSDFQTDVPQEGQKAFQTGTAGIERLIAQQDHNVYVGAGVQFATAITAHCHQSEIGCVYAEISVPSVPEQFVHQPGAGWDQLMGRNSVLKQRLEPVIALLEQSAE